MNRLKLSLILLLSLAVSGCAGVILAGAATTASLVTDPRTTQEIWNDNNIEFEVAGIANKAPFNGKTRITASSYQGIVVLMGQAENSGLLNEFENKARKTKGVKTIHNQVRIKAPLSIGEISNDSWITTKVKSALLANSELNTIKIKVITENREVFLLGYVSAEQANLASDIARNISGVKQVIKAFQYSE
ncbi:BON domain-containing protein [Vibrio anguillarum]|uniref:BON domain-containing protein n=1 Tax=Vibrio anguillarum TaxID=55601 RepID=UPI00097E2E45|nr:BON domain-containing protein [Vibrio anguillarum]AQM18849.1 hemolysin [Vibrio anguillarum]AUB87237.1 hemolysin [Vibrio anguillarum]AUB90677.1 hemolysin [Vibrio anguillarum]AUB94117.1 hemolysin [Vibrio anguillarum]AUB97536.1 hemolysin [Vibrio anguillarum]